MTGATTLAPQADVGAGVNPDDLHVSGPPSPRQCGRCRATFPGDQLLDATDEPVWWACPACRVVMFGNDIGRRRAMEATALARDDVSTDAALPSVTPDDGARS